MLTIVQIYDSISSPEIQKVYLVDNKSSTGCIAGIYKLWELGIIKQPTINAVFNKWGNRNVIFKGSHREVINEINRTSELNSIGITGEIPYANSKILLRHSVLPQDVIYISQDLRQYEKQITKWFEQKINNDSILANTSSRITGVELFSLEHKSSFNYLAKIISRFELSGKGKQKESLKFIDLNSPVGLFNFLSSLSFAELGIIFGLFSATFGAGAWIAKRTPNNLKANENNK